MALMRCPDCGYTHNVTAPFCPRCGRDRERLGALLPDNKFTVAVAIIVTAALVVGAVMAFVKYTHF